jgi:hypothetical protein
LGENETPETISRFGSETSLIETAVPAGALAFVTVAVGTVVAAFSPSLFFAVTRARIVAPTSADASR